jgi:DNA-binding NtrC family response regulator
LAQRRSPEPGRICVIKPQSFVTEKDQINSRLVLLLTRDRGFENLLTEALSKSGAVVFVARNVGDALQIACARGRELDFAVIDFDDGCHGMTLLSSINTCREDLPIVAVISSDKYHAAALAYANGAAACLAKPITAAELALAINELRAAKPELAAA